MYSPERNQIQKDWYCINYDKAKAYSREYFQQIIRELFEKR